LKAYSAPQLHNLAFETVISSYQEAISVSGTMSAVNFEMNGAGKATHTKNSCLVKPSVSDFLADVEISARRSLDEMELVYFKSSYQSTNVVIANRMEQKEHGHDRFLAAHLESYSHDAREHIKALDARVRENLGARLVEVGIFPLNKYRAPVDVSKQKKQNRINAARRGMSLQACARESATTVPVEGGGLDTWEWAA
jgi:hypothetical protein